MQRALPDRRALATAANPETPGKANAKMQTLLLHE